MRREDAFHGFRERKSMGLVVREDAGPGSHSLCVFWTLCVFVTWGWRLTLCVSV